METNTLSVQNYDLNLLIAFHSIFKNKSITKASRELGVSQPAMSKSLNRLRMMFNDELFVRIGNEIQPTPFSRELFVKVQSFVKQSQEILDCKEKFDPNISEKTFTIASHDYTSLVFLPKIIQSIEEFKGIKVRVIPIDKWTSDEEVDLVFEIPQKVDKNVFKIKRLFDDELVCVLSKRNKLFGNKAITLEEYCSEGHLLISPDGNFTGLVDKKLEKVGVYRTIIGVFPEFLLAGFLVLNSEFLSTVPKRVYLEAFSELGLKALDLPFEAPQFSVHYMWPIEKDKSLANQWLRQKIEDIKNDF